jgi:hypothetical protein
LKFKRKKNILQLCCQNNFFLIIMAQQIIRFEPKITLKYFLLYIVLSFFSNLSFSQTLHHEMISSQGTSTTLSSGLLVSQTIGQQIVYNHSSEGLIVQQGYQQSFWSLYLYEIGKTTYQAKIYPNPVIDFLTIEIENFPDQILSIAIFDVNGRMVYNSNHSIFNSKVNLDLTKLSRGTYLLKFSGKEIVDYVKMIKQQ